MYNSSLSILTLSNGTFSGNSACFGGGMFNDGYLILTNCTFTGNSATKYSFSTGGGMFNGIGNLRLIDCILYGNIDSDGMGESAQIHNRENFGTLAVNYSCIQGLTGELGGIGNIGDDPLFADPNNNDYHLKSQAGRWNPNSQKWVQDSITSPCIDMGDPKSPIMYEPFPNGGRINIGAYGGTAEASKSYFGLPLCETIVAGDINGDCKVDFKDFAIFSDNWLERGP